MLRIAPTVWNDTLAHLRACGRGRRECAVLWTGPIYAHDTVDAAVHPSHTSTRGHYQLEDAWLQRFHVKLFHEQRSIRAQVHTHAGRAFHSATDDAYPAANTAGFLSLVLPRFAMRRTEEDAMWLAELTVEGRWRRVRVSDRIEGVVA